MTKLIFLSEIDSSLSPKVRSKIDSELVEEYAAEYRKPKHDMPPPVVFKDGKKFLIADGSHRHDAMKLAGLKAAKFEVREGTRNDCILYAIGANVAHGSRRSNADKRVAIELALREFPSMSDRAISELVSVNDETVKHVRLSLAQSGEAVIPEKRTGKDGKSYRAHVPEPATETIENKVNPQKTSPQNEKPAHPVPPRNSVPAPPKPAKKEVVRDETGYPIPEPAMPYWKRRDEARAVLLQVTKLRSVLKQAKENSDLLFIEVNFNAMEADLDRVYANLKVLVPHAVCFKCQGQLADKCPICKGRGVISEFKFRQIDPKLKKVREASCKK